jgi:polyhydroxyalkanoate synthase
MTVPADLVLADIPERIQSEVQRAIQRSIKGVEYFASSGPSLGSPRSARGFFEMAAMTA